MWSKSSEATPKVVGGEKRKGNSNSGWRQNLNATGKANKRAVGSSIVKKQHPFEEWNQLPQSWESSISSR